MLIAVLPNVAAFVKEDTLDILFLSILITEFVSTSTA